MAQRVYIRRDGAIIPTGQVSGTSARLFIPVLQGEANAIRFEWDDADSVSGSVAATECSASLTANANIATLSLANVLPNAEVDLTISDGVVTRVFNIKPMTEYDVQMGRKYDFEAV
jgi:hypothetical protein